MKGALGKLALACLVIVAAATLVAVGSAGPRDGAGTFAVFPGPGRVTYDELIAYRATFLNKSGTALTHVRFRQSVPVVGTVAATPYSHTCPSTPTTVSTPTGDEWVCDFGQVPANAPPLKLTIVWRAPTLVGDPDGCEGCLVSTGRWTVKEGINDPADPNDTFGKTTTFATLVAGDGGTETLLAGGYETAFTSCATPSSASGNLHTQQAIGVANPVSTTFCLPEGAFTIIPLGSGDPGYATTITETNGNARRTDMCLAALGANCDDSYVPLSLFPGAVFTVVIKVADAALPNGYKITSVSHNGTPMTAATCAASGDCVLLIDLDNKTKIWTIVVTSGANGNYSW